MNLLIIYIHFITSCNKKKIHFYKVALLMFRVKTLSAPSVFRTTFIEHKDIHNYDTRQREKFHVPDVKRNYMQRTISCRGGSCLESYLKIHYLWSVIVIIQICPTEICKRWCYSIGFCLGDEWLHFFYTRGTLIGLLGNFCVEVCVGFTDPASDWLAGTAANCSEPTLTSTYFGIDLHML